MIMKSRYKKILKARKQQRLRVFGSTEKEQKHGDTVDVLLHLRYHRQTHTVYKHIGCGANQRLELPAASLQIFIFADLFHQFGHVLHGFTLPNDFFSWPYYARKVTAFIA